MAHEDASSSWARPGGNGRGPLDRTNRARGGAAREVSGRTASRQHPEPVATAHQGARPAGRGHRRPRCAVPVRVPQWSRVRVVVHLPQDVVDQYGGGFIGMLRPQLYRRLLDSPGRAPGQTPVSSFEQDAAACACNSATAASWKPTCWSEPTGSTRWCAAPCGATPRNESTTCTSSGGSPSTTLSTSRPADASCRTTRTIQGSWTSIRHEGRAGFQWWVLGAFDSSKEFTGDLHPRPRRRWRKGSRSRCPQLVAATDPTSLQRWPIRDRPPLEQWSKGRATLVGDAAHPTSPYAAYGAGMSIEDGYFLGRRIAGVDISDPVALSAALAAYEAPRKPHTAFQVDRRRTSSGRSSTTFPHRSGRSGTCSSTTPRSCRR